MTEVTRYDLTEDVSTGEVDITPVPERMQGRYVTFEDYEALAQQLKATTNSLTNAEEELKSAGIEADTVQAGIMELADKLRIKQNHIKLRDTYIEELEQRAEAAEDKTDNLNNGWLNAISERDDARAKLAELEKQEPVAYVMGEETINDFNRGYEFFAVRDAEHEEEMNNIPLFIRPAPAIDLAELVPDKWYFQLTFGIPNLDGMTPYQAHGAAWEQCRVAILRNIEMAGNAGKEE